MHTFEVTEDWVRENRLQREKDERRMAKARRLIRTHLSKPSHHQSRELLEALRILDARTIEAKEA